MKIIAFLFFYFVIYYYIKLYKQIKTNNMNTKELQIKDALLKMLANFEVESLNDSDFPEYIYIIDQNLGYMEYATTFDKDNFMINTHFYRFTKEQVYLFLSGNYNVVYHYNEIIGFYYNALATK